MPRGSPERTAARKKKIMSACETLSPSELSAQYPALNITGGRLLNGRVTGDIA